MTIESFKYVIEIKTDGVWADVFSSPSLYEVGIELDYISIDTFRCHPPKDSVRIKCENGDD